MALAKNHGRADDAPLQGGGQEEPQKKSPRGTEVLVADGLALPFRLSTVDFAICVAVIHHMSTRERRQEAIRHLLDCVRRPSGKEGDVGGTVLVYVLGAGAGSSRRGWDQGGIKTCWYRGS